MTQNTIKILLLVTFSLVFNKGNTEKYKNVKNV